MGKSHTIALEHAMIDTSTKQQGGMGVMGDREKPGLKTQSYREQQTHCAINLPTNVIESDSEDYEEENSSEDDNDLIHNGLMYRTGKLESSDQVTCDFKSLKIDDKQSINVKDKLVQKLVALTKEYLRTDRLKTESTSDAETKAKGLKARSPYRNRLNEHKQKPFERHDLSVTTAHGNGGRVFVQSLSPTIVPEPVANFPKDNLILDAIQDKDFIASFIDLPSDEAEQVFLNFIDYENESQERVVPQNVVVPQAMMSPQSSLTPDHSPNHGDFYDSSYETGSPGSTVVTSPGSPNQPRTSVSSESDQELDPAMETLRSQLPTSQTIIIPLTVVPKSEPKMRPLGEVVNYVSTSASKRLYELSKSTSFCSKHFIIQLVRVFMTAKAENSADKIEGFTTSLMSTMKTRTLSKSHEWDIWQLGIYAHIEFLKAPDRLLEYRSALKSRDEFGHPLLYIAAVQRYEKPIIARYIAESMSLVGLNPLEAMDDAGNTILHLVAEQGDSHMHVLSELLMAVGVNNVVLSNAAGQTPLHVAARSPRPQLTTLLSLLKMGARPFDLDRNQMTPLHYYIQGMPRTGQELEVVRKMLQAPMSLNKESLEILDQLRTEVPNDIANLILEEVSRNCSKEKRPRKIERR